MNKHYLALSLLIASVLLAGQSALTETPEHTEQPAKVAPAEALARLQAGNQRFVAGKLQQEATIAKQQKQIEALTTVSKR